jgi:hypothetical protein
MIRPLLLATYLCLALAAPTHSQNSESDQDFAALLEKYPDVIVKRELKVDRFRKPNSQQANEPPVEIVTYERGGAKYHGETTDGKTRWMGIDHSRHGAILCTHAFYVLAAQHIDSCEPGDNTDKRDAIQQAISTVHDFIVENSITPITRQQLDEQLAANNAKKSETEKTPSAENVRQTCKYVNSITQNIMAVGSTPEERQAALKKRLGPPRWPVLNPCL